MSLLVSNIGQELVGAQAGLVSAMQGGQDIALVVHDVMAAEDLQQNLQH